MNKPIVLITAMILAIFLLHNFYSIMPQAEQWTGLDYQNHFKYMENPELRESDGYPNIYIFYPYYPYSWYFHLAVTLTLCIYLFAQTFNKTGFQAAIVYLFSLQPIYLMAIGVLKEVLILELILLLLVIFLRVYNTNYRKPLLFITIAGLLIIFGWIQPPHRIVGMFTKGYNNFYFSAMWGFLTFPIAIQQLRKHKDIIFKYLYGVILITLFILGSFFETRLLGLSFLLQLPLTMKYAGGLINGIRKK